MASRQIVYARQHVAALNIVEVEFYGDSKVIPAHKELIKLLADSERWETASSDENRMRKLLQETDDLRTKLLNAMAKSLNYILSDIDILRGGYYPTVLSQFDNNQVIVQNYLADLAKGSRSLPVTVHDFRSAQQVAAELKAMPDA